MLARSIAVLVWVLVVASSVGWGLKLFATPAAPPAQAVVAAPPTPDSHDWLRLFGTTPTETAEATRPPVPEGSRFRLVGVVAPRPAAAHLEGVALIEVDGKSPRAYRTGAVVDGEHVLLSVHPRAVAIGPIGGQAKVTLELPPLPLPNVGVPGSTRPAPPAPASPAAAVGLPSAASNAPPPQQSAPPKAGPAPSADAAPPPTPNPGMFPAGRRKPAAAPPPASPAATVPDDPDPEPASGNTERSRLR